MRSGFSRTPPPRLSLVPPDWSRLLPNKRRRVRPGRKKRPTDMEKFNVICPCCEATLTIDAQTGALLAHEEQKKAQGSLEDLAGDLTKKKELREQLFAQEMSSMKDRERLLEEKFQEALKRADTDSD